MIGKKLQLRIYYWLNRVRANFFKYLFWSCFLLSIILSSLILVPNLLTHKLYMFGIETPRVLQIDGEIILQKEESNPGIGATVEIGGYKTVADQDGKFHIKFLSKSYDNIPVVITMHDKCPIVKRISFKWDEYKKTEAITIDGK